MNSGEWAYQHSTYNETILNSLYALSGPITATPEPATFSLLASAVLVLGGIRLARRRLRMPATVPLLFLTLAASAIAAFTPLTALAAPITVPPGLHPGEQ